MYMYMCPGGAVVKRREAWVRFPAESQLAKSLQQALNLDLLRLFGPGRVIILDVPCTAYHCRHVKDPPLPQSQRAAGLLADSSHSSFSLVVCMLHTE